MKTVRAKFKVGFVEDQSYEGKKQSLIRMYPVYSDDPNSENKTFTDATPSGELSLLITVPETAAFFEPDQEYYLDITKAN